MDTKKKKLIYLAPDIDLSKNEGGKVHTLGEIKYLQEHFDSILVICQNKNLYKLDNLIFPKIKTFIIPHWIHKPLFRIFIESPFFILHSLYLRVKGYKYLIERSYRFGGWFSLFFYLFGGKSLYLMIEPLYFENAPLLNIFTKIISKPLQKAIKYFLITYPTMTYLIDKDKTKIVWTGADTDIFNTANKDEELKQKIELHDNKPIIFYSGSIQNWHSVDLILDCASEMPDIIFLLVISAKEKQNIKNLQNIINTKNLKNITIKENISHQDIPHYINLSTICLALYEKNNKILKKFDYFYSPIKVHEYKACGKPIIASNIGNLIPLVKESGILIENNKENLKNAISLLLTNKEVYYNLSQNALREVEKKYNWKAVVNYYKELFYEK